MHALNHERCSAVWRRIERSARMHVPAVVVRSFPRWPTAISCRDHVRGCHQRRPRPGGPGGGEKTNGRKAKGRKEKGRGLAGKMKSTLFTHFQIEELTGVSASHSNGSPPNSFTLKWSSPQFLHTEMALASTLKWFSYLYCENENRVDFA